MKGSRDRETFPRWLSSHTMMHTPTGPRSGAGTLKSHLLYLCMQYLVLQVYLKHLVCFVDVGSIRLFLSRHVIKILIRIISFLKLSCTISMRFSAPVLLHYTCEEDRSVQGDKMVCETMLDPNCDVSQRISPKKKCNHIIIPSSSFE